MTKLTPEQVLNIAKTWFRPGTLVQSVMGGRFVVSAIPNFTFNHTEEYLYCDAMMVFSFKSSKWATIIGREELSLITKEQKEHIVNLIKSI